MILRENLLKIGKIQRTHGLQGELTFTFSSDILDELDVPYLICEIDGIFVPYFIENYRLKNDDTVLIKFEGINNDEDSRILINAPLYIEKQFLPEEINEYEVEGYEYYIGFKIIDKKGDLIGNIVDIDAKTENVLFLVIREDKTEVIIPATDNYIIQIDDDKRILQMDLPEGLLDLSAIDEVD